ncbi:hypothetical protein [Nonomuraea insulae]|uniref:Uncharacterized protein n=1 Tax=Nonomuraea insulae TaxID=1616787 RepID=A0ABW1CZ82_9ACTN
MVAPGEWEIVVTDNRLVKGLDAGGNPVYPVCHRAAEVILYRFITHRVVLDLGL